MSRYIDAEWLKAEFPHNEDWNYPVNTNSYVVEMIDEAPHIDLDDYVPKDFHDKTCEAMAKRHQEEIADMVSVVRCKECRYCKRKKGTFKGEPIIFYRCEENNRDVESDDFCSYGERSKR